MKKKIVALLLCTVLAVSVTGCANNKDKNGESVHEGTENVGGTETSKPSASIEYDAKEYVTLGNYEGLEVTLDQDYEVDDKTVADYVNDNVIVNYPYYKDLDKTIVEKGDFADIDYSGTRDGEKFDGGTAEGSILEIGNAGFIDGFEDGVVGMKVGEEKDLNLTFPEDYQNNPDLAGVDVVFHVKVNRIVEKQDMSYDKLTDEYVTYLSEKTGMSYTTAEDMIKDIRSYLESASASSKNSAIRASVLSQLLENCSVEEMPDELLDAKLAEALKQYETYYCQDGSKLEDYVEQKMGTTYDEFLAQVTSEVEQDTKIQLILEAIAQEKEVTYEEEDFEIYINNLVANNGYEKNEDLYLTYADNAEDGEAHLRKIYVCNLALQSIIDDAKVTVEESTESNTEAVDNTEAVGSTES